MQNQTADSQIPLNKLDNHLTGGQFKLRLQPNPALCQKLIHKAARTGIALQEDAGAVQQLFI